MTFSIIARDPETGDLGIAVQSKFLAVGSVVGWGRGGVGMIATQSYANTTYGPRGLALLEQGLSASEALQQLTEADPERDLRQAAIITLQGTPATFTGAKCHATALGQVGEHYAAQGNILVNEETVTAMGAAFEASSGPLWTRLVNALAAGQAAGGDSRGQQSAALLIVRENGGYGGMNDRMIDLRVDDHPQPIAELQRLLDIHTFYFLRAPDAEILPITMIVARELQELLQLSGDYQGELTGVYEQVTREAFLAYAGRENLEERWHEESIELDVLNYMRRQLRPE